MECIIQPIRQSIVNCYIIRHEGAILVDTGMQGNAEAVLRAAAGLGLRPGGIRLIVLTHGHWDHAGSAADIADLTGAPIALHQEDARWLDQGLEVPVVPVTAWGRLLCRVFSLGPVRNGMRVRPFTHAIRLGDEDLPLQEYGIPGKVVHTPGHTWGSVSVVLEDGRALVGCAAMNGLPSLRRHPVLPILAEDTGAVIISWRRLFAMGVRTAYPAHGGPFRAEAMRSVVGG